MHGDRGDQAVAAAVVGAAPQEGGDAVKQAGDVLAGVAALEVDEA